MRRTLLCLCITSVLLMTAAVLTNLGFTQAKQAPSAARPQEQAMRIIDVTVKFGMGPEWESFLKNEMIPALKKAGATQSSVWKTAQFGKAGKYLMVSPMASLATLDGPSPLIKVLGQDGFAALMAKVPKFVDSARLYMITSRTNLSIVPKSGYVYKMGVLVTNRIAPGRTDEFEKNLKEVVTVVGKTNAKGILTARVGLGGDPNTYTSLVLFDSFADMDKFIPAFTKAAADAKLASDAGIAVNREYEVISNIPELSVEPPAPKAAK